MEKIKKVHYDYINKTYNSKEDWDFLWNVPSPKEICSYLDKYIIGQENAKKYLAVAIYSHFKNLVLNKRFNLNFPKNNILLIGPSGTGKTFMIQILSKLLNIPIIIVDATSFTEAGYVGEDVDSILQKLFNESFYDLDKTEVGIVYIDEVDKLSKKSNDLNSRDISGEGVQQALLKLIEGTNCTVHLDGNKKMNNTSPSFQINTSNILFICGGAFPGLDKIISERVERVSLGFGDSYSVKKLSYDKLMNLLDVDDLVKFGIIEELIGRLPIIIKLNELNIKTLKLILSGSDNSILENYKTLFSINGVNLIVHDKAEDLIAREAYKKKTGARSLRGIVYSLLVDIIYEMESLNGLKDVVIHDKILEKGCGKPILIYKK